MNLFSLKFCLIVLGVLFASLHLAASVPSEAELDAKKSALLKYIRDVSASDRYILGESYNEKDWDLMKTRFGRIPALMCVEYLYKEGMRKLKDGEKPVAWKSVNPVAERHYKGGGLVRIVCHFPNPYFPNYGGLRVKLEDKSAKLVASADSPEKSRWLAMLEEVAAGIRDLNDKGVIPIFGPMHEMNGEWFWWGAKIPVDTQRKLWNQIKAALDAKGCRVVWLNALAAGRSLEPYKLPDGSYDFFNADIVGLDVYKYKRAKNLGCIGDKYNAVIENGKIFAVAEFGVKFGLDDKNGAYDVSTLTEQLDAHCPRSFCVLFWHGPWAIPIYKNAEKLMNDRKFIKFPEVVFDGK